MKDVDYYNLPKHPVLLVISGPSGVGKDTIARQLLEIRPDDFYFVVTATTRPPREGEVDGVDYFFLSNNEFAQMIDQNELLEYAIVYNDYKGVPKRQIREALASGKDVIMRVDVQGAMRIRQLIPNAILLFLLTPTEADLVNRLRTRRSESDHSLQLRIAMARKEIERIREFDYYVVNAQNEQDVAVNRILSIIDAARCRVRQQPIVL